MRQGNRREILSRTKSCPIFFLCVYSNSRFRSKNLSNSPSLPTAADPIAPAKHKTKAARAVSISAIIPASIALATKMSLLDDDVRLVFPNRTACLGTNAAVRVALFERHSPTMESKYEFVFIILSLVCTCDEIWIPNSGNFSSGGSMMIDDSSISL